jgi:2-methylcitrate dehydratase PrpD
VSAQSFSAAHAIAKFSVAFDRSRLSQAHVVTCGRAIADTVAVAIAGWREPTAQRALDYARTLEGSGPGRLWGRAESFGLETAVLCNGIAAHALDYDDGSNAMGGHPSVVLLPALMALADLRGSTGIDVALAYTVGFETACGVGTALSQSHFAQGWHLTSTIGTLASAVACARLIGLDEAATSHAIGLAFARTGGSRASFGTDAKSVQAGEASATGLRAALLAETGLTAATDAIDGALGFTSLYSDGESIADALAELGSTPLFIDQSGVEIKKYSACYALHRPIDAVLDLKSKHSLTSDNVARIDVLASHNALKPLLQRLPVDGTEGRFSMHYVLAAAIRDGAITLSSFADDAVVRDELRPLMSRIHFAEADGPVLPRWAELTVTLDDDSRHGCRIDALRGSPQLPLTEDELLRKISDCLVWGGSSLEPADFLAAAMGFASGNMSDLIDIMNSKTSI